MTFSEAMSVAAAVVLSLGGGGAIVVALSGWLGKVWAERILERDRQHYQTELERMKGDMERASRRLQGDIDETIHVHRLHFETEFRALQDVWQKMSRLRRTMSTLRPIFSIGPVKETAAERLEALNERFKPFSEALSDAWIAVDENRPFLSEDIHTRLTAALQAGNAESVSLRLHPDEDKTVDWYERGEKNINAVIENSNEVVNLIRARLQALALYPDEK